MPANDYQRYVSTENRKSNIKRYLVEALVSVLLITLAIIAHVQLKKYLLKKKVFPSIELKPNSEGYEKWLNPPVTTVRSYHLFNITNPMEIVTDPSSAILRFTESPPYTYTLDTKKTDIRWSNNDKDMSYSVERLFRRHPTRFNPSSVNDTGTFVDMLRATLRTQFQTKADQNLFLIGGKETFYHRNAVDQLEGFTSELFNTLKEKMTGPNRDKSGFIYRYNGSRLYNVTIKAGLMDKGQVISFDSEVIPFHTEASKYSFPIYDGLTFAPMLFDKDSLQIFQSDFCRPIRIKFNRNVRKFGGIDMREYKIQLIDFDQCTNPSDPTTCPEVDKLDVSKCISATLPDNTIFLSKAHFYGSKDDVSNLTKVEGFNSMDSKYDSFIYFEPYSGTPFEATYRMQLNVDIMVDPMKQAEYGSELEWTKKKGVRRLLPVFWLDQKVTIDQSVIDRLGQLHRVFSYARWGLLAIAIILSLVFITVMECLARRSVKNNNQYTCGNYIRSEPLV